MITETVIARSFVPGRMRVETPLPAAMQQALVDFGLMAAFRASSPALQRDYVRRVQEDTRDAGLRDRIAEILDDLAAAAPAYKHVMTAPS